MLIEPQFTEIDAQLLWFDNNRYTTCSVWSKSNNCCSHCINIKVRFVSNQRNFALIKIGARVLWSHKWKEVVFLRFHKSKCTFNLNTQSYCSDFIKSIQFFSDFIEIAALLLRLDNDKCTYWDFIYPLSLWYPYILWKKSAEIWSSDTLGTTTLARCNHACNHNISFDGLDLFCIYIFIFIQKASTFMSNPFYCRHKLARRVWATLGAQLTSWMWVCLSFV